MYFLTLYLVSFLAYTSISSSATGLPGQLVRSKRIVGGKGTSIEKFPYLAALERHSKFLCGGAIITPYHVLTAAHCVNKKNSPRSYSVRLGSSWRLRGGTIHKVRSIVVHERYGKGRKGVSYNDLALLRLDKKIKLDGKTKRAVPMVRFAEEVKNGVKVVLAGWGSTYNRYGPLPRKVQTLEMKIVDKKRCDGILRKRSDAIHKGQICAAAPNKNRGACAGDSGSPLVVNGRLVGIASSVDIKTCHSKPIPNVFNEIAYFRKWIDKRIKLR